MIENFIAVRAGSDPAPQIIRIDPAATNFNIAVRKVIHCDLYEIVRVQSALLLPPGVVLLVDKAGWFVEPLRVNKFASIWNGDMIVGDVLLASEGYRNGEPSIVGLDGFQLQWLRQALRI